YPEKFLYVDLNGLSCISIAVQANPELEHYTHLELEVVLRDEVPNHLTPTSENIRLFCTPIVNLFEADARPLEVDHRQHEYRVVPEGHPRDHYDIFSVDEVQAWGHEDRQQYPYHSYDSFAFCRQEEHNARRLFWQKLKPAVVSRYGYDTYMSFFDYE